VTLKTVRDPAEDGSQGRKQEGPVGPQKCVGRTNPKEAVKRREKCKVKHKPQAHNKPATQMEKRRF